jgi:hypothetical protein
MPFSHAGIDSRSSRHKLDLLVQELRGDVSAVGPSQRVEFGVYGELLEQCAILERLENLTIQFVSKIHISLGTVREAKVDRVIP